MPRYSNIVTTFSIEEEMIQLKNRIEELEKIKSDISKKVEDIEKEIENDMNTSDGNNSKATPPIAVDKVTGQQDDKEKDDDKKNKGKKSDEEKAPIIEKIEGLKWWLERIDPEAADILKESILASIKKESNESNQDSRNPKKFVPATDKKQKKKNDNQKKSNSNSSEGERSRTFREELRAISSSRSKSRDKSGKSFQQQQSTSRDRIDSRSNGRSSHSHRGGYAYSK
ncbi:corepressor interacting with RBPJ 1-like [Microplitis mediator]|uniref:corepressor interacting with RBPJ 1-like n=1 Tax=Microplitis mediator TaxID=375433 RepID=UPI0025548957|nr:corepressor interacting with RBPJ 1-like [Microplitis mediator]